MAAYVTNTEIKNYLQNSGISFNSGDDTLLTTIAGNATTWFETETARVFDASADSTRYLDADIDVCGYRLKLRYDLCSITSITNGDGNTVTSSQYVTNPRNITPYYEIQLLRSSAVVWQWVNDPENAITIVGKWGYSTTPPTDVKHAVLILAAALYKARSSPVGITDPIATLEGTVITPITVPAFTRQVACKYRRYT